MTRVEYLKTTYERKTAEVHTLDDLLGVLLEYGFGKQLAVEFERDGRKYDVRVELWGDTTGLSLARKAG